MMRTVHLFAGAGGGMLADLILGHRPTDAFEINPFACQVLTERRDNGWFPGLRVHEGDVRDFDFSFLRGGVDQISAGFPCQDISAAGRGEGLSGKKSGLVTEVWRAIDAVRPGLVFLENSPNIRTRGRTEVIRQLVERGYSWRDGTLAASDVGAPHIRKRWWLLAANSDGLRKLEHFWEQQRQRGWDSNCNEAASDAYGAELRQQSGRSCWESRQETCECGRVAEDTSYSDSIRRDRWARNEQQAHGGHEPKDEAADALRYRLQIALQSGWIREADGEAIQAAAGYTGAFYWAPPDAGLCGMVHGVSDWVHGNKGARIEALGNAQVPLAAAAAWMMLASTA